MTKFQILTNNDKLTFNDFKSLTVCFISTVTFHDGITQKVIKIIQFCKKSLKDNALAFYN